MTTRQTASDIEAEAILWVMRLDREGRTPALSAAIQAWAEGDARRAGALLQAEAAWRSLELSAKRQTQTPTEIQAPRSPSRGPERTAGATSRRTLLLAGAGAALAASGAGVYLAFLRPETHQTATGQIATVTLPDASVMTLNTASRVRVSYTRARRTVWIDEGEAWFQVAHAVERPFVVMSGLAQVQAVGTAFSVRRLEAETEVMVSEGKVRVSMQNDVARSILLAKGDSVIVTTDGRFVAALGQPGDVERRLAWRSGRLEFAGETVAEAVAEFNRYSQTSIVVRDKDLAGQRLYGAFRLDDPAAFARTAAISLGVSAVVGEDRIFIGAG